jgi:hypothetical protein
MKTYCILTLIIAILALSFNAKSATFTVSVRTVGNYELNNSFDFSTVPFTKNNQDFSTVPFTKNNQIKQYNLDDFAVDPSVHKSDLQGLNMQVTIDKYEVDGVVTVVVTYP